VNQVHKFSIYLIALMALVNFSCCKQSADKAGAVPQGPPPIPKLEAYIVKQSSVAENIELPGSVISNESTTINPEISGRLTFLNASEGKTVSKGTLLAKLYDGDLQSQLKKLDVQIKVQEQTVARYAELLRINGVSQQEYDLVQLQVNNLRADRELVKSNIQRTVILAPFTGTLGLRMVSPGAYVTPQSVITSIRQNSSLKIDFTVPERYATEVQTGKKVAFSIEGSNKPYEARVTATESGVSEDNRSLRVRALVSNADDQLLPGVFIKVVLKFEADTATLLIPTQAVIPQARGKKVAMYKNGNAVFRDIKTGTRDAAMIKVTEGLMAGDTILTTGLMGLKPNGKVAISKILP
jgi:membrane fusion protein (multidrug efflux system)